MKFLFPKFYKKKIINFFIREFWKKSFYQILTIEHFFFFFVK